MDGSHKAYKKALLEGIKRVGGFYEKQLYGKLFAMEQTEKKERNR